MHACWLACPWPCVLLCKECSAELLMRCPYAVAGPLGTPLEVTVKLPMGETAVMRVTSGMKASHWQSQWLVPVHKRRGSCRKHCGMTCIVQLAVQQPHHAF